MANVVTGNFTLHPEDGWVLVGGAATAFLRVSYVPHHVPVFLYNGSAPPSTFPAAATGTVTFTTGVPTTGQTITIGSETYTFLVARTGPFTVAIGGTNLLTATNFAAAIQSDSALVSASDTAGAVTITAKSTGAMGNYALTKTASNVTLSGAVLTGGASAAAGFRMECGGTHFDGAYANNVYARIMNNSNDKVNLSVWTL